MTARASQQAINEAGAVYAQILADPERRARLVRDLAELEAREQAEIEASDSTRRTA